MNLQTAVLLLGIVLVRCQYSVCTTAPVLDASFSASASCFDAFPNEDNSLANMNFTNSCSVSENRAADLAQALDLLRTSVSGEGSTARGTNDCYFAGFGYPSSSGAFPSCPQLSGKPNCRVGQTTGGRGVDYDAYVTRVLCSLAYTVDPSWNLQTNMCFKTLQRLICSMFDPAMVTSTGFDVLRMTLAPHVPATVQEYRWCQQSGCDMLAQYCGKEPKLTPIHTGLCSQPIPEMQCQTDADCVGFNAGRHCFKSTTDASQSACVAVDCSPQTCQYGGCMTINPNTVPAVPPTDDDGEDDKGGNVALIVLMSFLGACTLYCCLGFMYKRFVQKATGRDQIPNVELWAGLGRCCGNMFTRCRCRRGDGYSAAPPPYDWN